MRIGYRSVYVERHCPSTKRTNVIKTQRKPAGTANGSVIPEASSETPSGLGGRQVLHGGRDNLRSGFQFFADAAQFNEAQCGHRGNHGCKHNEHDSVHAARAPLPLMKPQFIELSLLQTKIRCSHGFRPGESYQPPLPGLRPALPHTRRCLGPHRATTACETSDSSSHLHARARFYA